MFSGPAGTSHLAPDRCPSRAGSHSGRGSVITYRTDSPRGNGCQDRPASPANHGQGGHSAASWGVRVHERYMEGTPEVDGRWTDAAKPVVCPNVRTGLGDCGRPSAGWSARAGLLLGRAGRYLNLRVWVFSRVLQGPVRGCPWDRPRRSAGVRTYSVQRAWYKHPSASFAQVRGYMEVQAGAVCKTVGSAYVGSNPTPATAWGNGPIAADSRLCGPFLLCPAMCHRAAL